MYVCEFACIYISSVSNELITTSHPKHKLVHCSLCKKVTAKHTSLLLGIGASLYRNKWIAINWKQMTRENLHLFKQKIESVSWKGGLMDFFWQLHKNICARACPSPTLFKVRVAVLVQYFFSQYIILLGIEGFISGLYYKTITIVIMTIVSDATIWSVTLTIVIDDPSLS
jgi:hypothetical protein